MHAEHAENCKLQQYMLAALLGRALAQEGLQGSFTAEQIIQVCQSSRQDLLAVAEVDFREQDTCV